MSTEYHKIQTVWLRDPATNHKTLLEGQWALPEFEYLADRPWEWTEKIDGTNIRVRHDGERVRYDGKTERAQIPTHLLARLQEMFDDNAELAQLGPEATLYGEGYGAKIQKGGGHYIADSQSFILFDVRIGKWWLKREDVIDIAGGLGIAAVPIMGHGSLLEAIDVVREGFKSEQANGRCVAEGLVMRPMVELFDRGGHRVICKVKHKDFPR